MPINSFLYPAPSTPTFAYNVDNSCRFDSGSSDRLLRTFGTPTSAKTWTLSFWIKRCALGSTEFYFNTDGGNEEDRLQFGSADTLNWFEQNSSGGTVADLNTSQKFRDVSAWYHIVVARDSTQSTASNRIKIYVNGTQVTSWTTETYPSQNDDSRFNTAVSHEIGARNNGTFIDAYLAEIVFIDGQQLDATSFGEFDSDSPNIWKPIDVSGLTFGNNGFHLDFEDSSALGNDVSGNDNDFSVSNLTAIDQSTDTCTNNFATLNPLVKGNASITLSEGNLKGVFPGSWTAIPATFGLTKGKWYFEAKNETSGQNAFIGVVTENQDWDDSTPYDETTGVVLYGPGGRKTVDGTDTDGFFATLSSGQIVGVALDLDSSTKTIQFSVNGTDTPNSTPVDLPSTFDNVFIFPYFSGNSSSATSNWQVNFGSPSYSISSGNSDANGYGNFEYSVPSGFYSINTKNLAEFG